VADSNLDLVEDLAPQNEESITEILDAFGRDEFPQNRGIFEVSDVSEFLDGFTLSDMTDVSDVVDGFAGGREIMLGTNTADLWQSGSSFMGVISAAGNTADLLNANGIEDQVQSAADLTVDLLGLFGGPLCSVFAAAYAVGGMINDATGLSDSIGDSAVEDEAGADLALWRIAQQYLESGADLEEIPRDLVETFDERHRTLAEYENHAARMLTSPPEEPSMGEAMVMHHMGLNEADAETRAEISESPESLAEMGHAIQVSETYYACQSAAGNAQMGRVAQRNQYQEQLLDHDFYNFSEQEASSLANNMAFRRQDYGIVPLLPEDGVVQGFEADMPNAREFGVGEIDGLCTDVAHARHTRPDVLHAEIQDLDDDMRDALEDYHRSRSRD